MATQQQISEARKLLEERWSDAGECRSCGWHALLWEHNVDDAKLAEAIDGDGVLELGCRNGEDDDHDIHRGVQVRVAPCAHPNRTVRREGMTGTVGTVYCPDCGYEREWNAY